MAILIYRHSWSNSQFQTLVETRALSPDATVNGLGGFFSPVIGFDITSTNAEDTDGTNLTDFLEPYGFSLVTASGSKLLDGVNHWGSFDLADAPTTGVGEGDLGYCNDGDVGSPCLTVYQGGNWKVVQLGANIATS